MPVFVLTLMMAVLLSLAYSLYCAMKLYLNLNPKVHRIDWLIPLILFLPSSHTKAGRGYYWRFLVSILISIFCFAIVALYQNYQSSTLRHQ